MAECNLATLLEQACANHFDVAAQDKVEFQAILLQLLCNFTGGVTQQCFSGHGPPTTQIPAFGAGTYWDMSALTLYNWDSDTSTWV